MRRIERSTLLNLAALLLTCLSAANAADILPLAGEWRFALAWISTGANSPNSDRQDRAICVWLGVPIRPRSLV